MMRFEDEVVTLQAQVGIIAGQVGRMIHVISAYTERGFNTEAAKAKLAVLENLMWALHSRHAQLKAGASPNASRMLH